MLVYRGVSTNKITQKWGESKACVKYTDGRRVVLSKRGDFCPAGSKDFYRSIGLNSHNGTDIATYYREPLHFPVIAETKWWARAEADSAGGIGVDVFSQSRVHIEELPKEAGTLARRDWEENEHKVYVKFRFWHLQSFIFGEDMIQVGTFSDGRPEMKPEVKLGDVIGLCDSSGLSSGDHYHGNMKVVNKASMTLDIDNGWYGAIPFPNFQNTFILDLLGIEQKLSLSQHIAKVRRMFMMIPLVSNALLLLQNNLIKQGK